MSNRARPSAALTPEPPAATVFRATVTAARGFLI
jgi:hypothetical protein